MGDIQPQPPTPAPSAAPSRSTSVACGSAAVTAAAPGMHNATAATATIASVLHWLHDQQTGDGPDWLDLAQRVTDDALRRFHREVNDDEFVAGDPKAPAGGDRRAFAVDLPTLDPDGEWVTFDYYDTRADATAAARQHFGADHEGRITIVSEFDALDGEEASAGGQ